MDVFYGNIRKKKLGLISLLIYTALLFSAGYYFREYMTFVGVVLVFVELFILIFFQKRSCSIQQICVLLLFIIILLSTNFVMGCNLVLMFLLVAKLVQSFLFSEYVPYDDFVDSYILVMELIAVVSLFGYLLLSLDSSLLSIFPSLSNSRGNRAFFMLFGSVSDFRLIGISRNQGIFWEPGAYQFFLCIAYLFEFYRRGIRRKLILVLFLISMVTTVSTTGIIVAVSLLILTISRTKGNISAFKAFLGILLVVAVSHEVLPQLSGFWKFTLVTKTDQVLNYQTGEKNESASRMESVIYPLKAFSQSPLLGIGTEGYDKLSNIVGHSMFTCTPVNWFAYYGLIWGLLICVGIFRFLNVLIRNKFESFFVFLIICVSSFSEELSSNYMFLIMSFYGIQHNPRMINGEKDEYF
jgi:hypothetical protein